MQSVLKQYDSQKIIMTQDISQNNSSQRIIIVEDDKLLLNSVVKYLTLDGYDVIGVSSAYEFYQHIFATSYVVAILDVGLPDQSGLVLAEYVRSNTNMRIIMFTALSSIDDELAGHQAGADIYLVKPINFRKLSASIATLVGRFESQSMVPLFVTETQQPSLSEVWRLFTTQWILQTPTGERIKLTTKELDFMTHLISTPKAVVPRFELLCKLGYVNNESGHHSLQSLINRLRQKIQRNNISSPIQTAHAIGYTFLADIIVE